MHIGRASFQIDALRQNLGALIEALNKASRPPPRACI